MQKSRELQQTRISKVQLLPTKKILKDNKKTKKEKKEPTRHKEDYNTGVPHFGIND